MRLPFSTTPDMIQCKINEIFKELPNVFGIADNILIVGYNADGKGCDRMLTQVIQIYHKENFKLNKGKCHFRYMRVPSIGEIISRCCMHLGPH